LATSAAIKKLAVVLTLVLTAARSKPLKTSEIAVLVGMFHGAAVKPAPQRWKRSLRTGDRKLARQIADTLDDPGWNVLAEQAITSFTDKIRDAKTRAAVAQIFADVFRTLSGREFGAGSLRAFADSWLVGIRDCVGW